MEEIVDVEDVVDVDELVEDVEDVVDVDELVEIVVDEEVEELLGPFGISCLQNSRKKVKLERIINEMIDTDEGYSSICFLRNAMTPHINIRIGTTFHSKSIFLAVDRSQ